MMSRKLTTLVAAACAGLVMMTGAALASPAQATVSLNVRSGPSSGYRVVDVLRPGERVEVESCRSNGWCYINHSGSDGWVSSRYLAQGGYYSRRTVQPPRYSPRYRRNVEEFQFRFGGPGFGFSFGTDDHRRPHHRDCFRRFGRTICR